MGRKKIKRALIDDPVFSSGLLVQRGGSLQSLVNAYGRMIKEEMPRYSDRPSRKGMFIAHENHKNGAIWLADDAGLGIVSHESFHATFWILDYCGMKLSAETEETYAYFLQFIVNRIVVELFGWR